MATKKNAALRNKPVQVSLPKTLLEEIDAQTGPRGRSAFVVNAVLAALRAKRSQDLDTELTAIYGAPGVADQLFEEALPMMQSRLDHLDSARLSGRGTLESPRRS